MGKKIHTDYDFVGGAKITGLPQSSAAGEPVIHEQLQAAIEGIAWKDAARVSTQGNLNLSSPGATIDGVSMTSGDRVLVRAQSSQPENGVYIWNGAASAMTRAPDASTFAELEAAVVAIEEGTDAGLAFRQTQVNGTIGSNNVVFTSFGGSAPNASDTQAGVVELATTAETNTGSDATRAVTPAGLAASNHAKKKHIATFGDNSATQFDLTHNFGTREVVVSVRQASDDAMIDCGIRALDDNTVRLNFVAAPATNAMKAVILA